MARSRNIKPGFFTNEILGTLDPIIGMTFVGLWCLADKKGRLEDRPLRIKAELFPYREGLDVIGYLTVLEQSGFIERYEVDGVRYIQVTNFEKHQSPHHTEKPRGYPPKPAQHKGRRDLTVKPPLDDGKSQVPTRSDSLIPDSLIPDTSACSPSASESVDDGFATFWQQYPKKVAKPQALKAWKKQKPDLAACLAALSVAKASAEWQKDRGQFIPHPATWLNARRWEDEVSAIEANKQAVSAPKQGDTRERWGATEVFDETMGWVPA